MAAGSSTAEISGVSRLTTRPTSSGPLAAIACRAVAVFSAVNQSSRTSGSRSATSCWLWSSTAKPSSKPMRAVAVSITQPVTVAAVSQPSHTSARSGVSPNSAPTSGTSNTVAAARTTTETTRARCRR